MSTKITDVSQLFANPAIAGERKELAQTKSVSVQFSNLLNQQQMGQSAEGFERQLSASKISDYAQYQKKENSIREANPVTLGEKVSKIEEKMTEYESAVKEVLEEELGVSEKDIEEAMEVLGLGFTDLTNQTNLAQLVSELTGESMTTLLCKEEFVNVIQQVSELTGNLLQELGMTMEEFNDVCKQMLEMQALNESDGQNPKEFENIPAEGEIQPDTEMQTQTQTQTQTQGDTLTAPQVREQQAETAKAGNPLQADAEAAEFLESDAAAEDNSVQIVHTGEGTENSGEESEPVETLEMPRQEETSDSAASNQQQDSQENSLHFAQGTVNTVLQGQQEAEVEIPQNEFAQYYQQGIDVQDVMEQVVQSARLTVSTNRTTMEMQLNPENLGKIFLEISTKEGIVSAKLVAQNDVVREALESQMADLKQNLTQAGVKVDAVEVTVSSHEFERNLEQNGKQDEQFAGQRESQEQSGERRRRNLNLNSLDELSGMMSEEESLVAQMMQDNGNTMDMKA